MASCAKEPEETTGSIYGIVTDAGNGEPIKSANVSLNPSGKSTVTGTDGRYEFAALQPGQYTVQVSKNDYETDTKQISVTPGQQAAGDITLQKASSLLKLSNNSLNFGKNWNTLSFSVGNAGITGSIDWRISVDDVDWITVSPLSGTTETGKTTEVVVTVLRDKVSGPASGIITVSDGGGSLPVYVTVNQDVEIEEGETHIAVDPEEVTLSSAYRKDITIRSYNGSSNYELFVKEENAEWLSFSKPMGILPAYNTEIPSTAITVGFIADRTGLSAGEYKCTAILRTGLGDLEIPVSMKVNADGSVDKTFDDFCKENFDTDGNGVISDEEIAGVTEIDCSNQGLISLDGIDRFTNLQSLQCENNRLTAIDISKNTQLRTLWCHNNRLTSLDVGELAALDYLRVEDNRLTALDISKNLNLSILYCENNPLTVLNVSKNTNLSHLRCYNNQLTALDVTQNTDLYWLECGNNRLTSLDITQNTKLGILGCGTNRLISLNVSQNTLLESLDCRENPLSNLDVSQTALTSLTCTGCQLTTLDVSMHKNLNSLYCYDNPLTTIYMPENYETTCTTLSVPPEAEIVVKSSEITGNTFEEYALANFDLNSDGVISESEASMITSIDCSGQNLTSMEGIEKFVNLENLTCSKNKLTTLAVSQNTKLTYLNCSQNQLTSLDISRNTVLQELDCAENFLTALDISRNVVLQRLFCHQNQLSVLNTTANTALQTLNCGENQLSVLDVTRNTALQSLSCDDNQLTSLDVDNNIALQNLGCNNNRLTVLDVNNNIALHTLSCANNQLTSLNIDGLTNLWQLYCGNNELSVLDISGCASLKDFVCDSNNLTGLDFSSNTALERIFCNYNQLTIIDISRNIKLLELHCTGNESLTTIYAFDDYSVSCTIDKPDTTQIIIRQ